MIKYISFDLDGTLADESFDKLVWNEEIPKMYAEKSKISLEDAKKIIYSEYYKALYIEFVKSWTDIEYWFNRLGLNNWQKLIQDMKGNVFVYPDVLEILEYLSKKYKLIIISAAYDKFLNVKLEAQGIKKYFSQVFSIPSDFGIPEKNRDAFFKVLEKLKIQPNELVHIGDDHNKDYTVPMSIGIKSFHLVRSKQLKEDHTIHSLLELKEKL